MARQREAAQISVAEVWGVMAFGKGRGVSGATRGCPDLSGRGKSSGFLNNNSLAAEAWQSPLGPSLSL